MVLLWPAQRKEVSVMSVNFPMFLEQGHIEDRESDR